MRALCFVWNAIAVLRNILEILTSKQNKNTKFHLKCNGFNLTFGILFSYNFSYLFFHLFSLSLSLCRKCSIIGTIYWHFERISTTPTDELVQEKERYKDIGDDLDVAFVELILKEQ